MKPLRTSVLAIGILVALIVGVRYLQTWSNDRRFGIGWQECLEAPDVASLIKLCDENIERGGGWDGESKAFYASRIAGAYQRQNDIDHAIEYFKKASNFEPHKARYLLEAADLLRDKGDCNAALAVGEKAVLVEPTKGSAFFGRGKTYICLNDYGRAGADFNVAILLNPIHRSFYIYRAALRNAQGDKDGAQADSAKAESLKDRIQEAVHIEMN